MKEKIIQLLKKYSGHDNIFLTSRGNTAIFIALYIGRKLGFNKRVLIQD
jgi:hypothetical protein